MADQTSGEACGHEPLCSLRDVDEMPSERRCTCQPGDEAAAQPVGDEATTLTEAEREALWGARYEAALPVGGFSGVRDSLEVAVEAILAARLAAARDDRGAADQQAVAALTAEGLLPHEDWCCAMGCTGLHGVKCPGCTCVSGMADRALALRAVAVVDARGETGGGES